MYYKEGCWLHKKAKALRDGPKFEQKLILLRAYKCLALYANICCFTKKKPLYGFLYLNTFYLLKSCLCFLKAFIIEIHGLPLCV